MGLSLQAYPGEALGACRKFQALENPLLPVATCQPWMSGGEIALALGKHQVRMRINTAEMFRGDGIGMLIMGRRPGRGNFKIGPGQGFCGLEVGEDERAAMGAPTIQVCLLHSLSHLLWA